MSSGKLTIAWTVPHRHPSGYAEDVEDYFVMTGKSDDTLKKWADKVMELAELDRRKQDEIRTERERNNGRMSASSQFPSSQWAPPTPAVEAPPFQFPPPLPGHGGQFADEDDDDLGFRSGRTTPSMSGSSTIHGYYPTVTNAGRRVQSQQGMPPQNHAELRARAMTEDQNGPSMTQWRQQGQQPQMPPMPRMMSAQSSMSAASEASFGHPAPRGSINRNMSTSRLGPSEEVDEGSDHTPTYSQRYPSQRGMMARAPSQGIPPTVPYPGSLLRNRSASSPNVFQQPHVGPSPSAGHTPILPGMAEYDYTDSVGMSSSSTLVGGQYQGKRTSGGGKRSSSESQSTETSESSSGPSPATPYANNASELRGSVQVERHGSGDLGMGGIGGGSAILIRVKCGEVSLGT
jgi:cell division control protein 24